MAIAEIELPDGRVVELEVPDGISEQQIMAWIQANPQELEKAPAAKTQDTSMGMSEMLGVSGRALANAFFPEKLRDVVPGVRTANEAVQGVSSGLATVPEGTRQAYNKVTGDEEELARLNAEYEQRKAKLRELTGDSTTVAVGDAIGQIAPFLMGGAIAGAPKAAGVLPGTARAMLGGAAGGAVGGYTAPLTTEQEAAGDRETNAALGGVVGGTLPALINPISRGVQWAKDVSGRMLPRQALDDAVNKMTGVNRGTNISDIVGDIKDKTRTRTAELRSTYETVKNSEKSVPYRLSVDESARYDPDPAMRDLMTAADRAAGRATPEAVVVPSSVPGQPNYQFPDRPLSEVRELISVLKSASREDTSRVNPHVLRGTIARLENQVDDWASRNPDTAQFMASLRANDQFYASEVAPMIDSGKGRPIAQWAEHAYSQPKLDTLFFSREGNTGDELADLMRRVPDMEDDLKKYFGKKLLDSNNPQSLLGLSTAQEALFTPGESRYLRGLQDALRDQTGDQTATHAVTRALGKVIGDFPEKARHGVRAYGDPIPEKFDLGSLATALRAAGLFRYNSEE